MGTRHGSSVEQKGVWNLQLALSAEMQRSALLLRRCVELEQALASTQAAAQGTDDAHDARPVSPA